MQKAGNHYIHSSLETQQFNFSRDWLLWNQHSVIPGCKKIIIMHNIIYVYDKW